MVYFAKLLPLQYSSTDWLVIKLRPIRKQPSLPSGLNSDRDTHFQSLVAVPLVKFNKVQKFWVGQVWLAQELFYYKYPFYLPDLFQRKLTKDEFEVQVQVFKIFSSENIQKIFLIKEFFQNYKSRLSNQQKTKMKGYFI